MNTGTTSAKSASAPAAPSRLRVWFDQHLHGLAFSLGRALRKPWATLLTVAVMGVALALLLIAYNVLVQPSGPFPKEWNIHLRVPLDAFKRWVVGNRATSPVFVFVFEPISAAVDYIIRRAEASSVAGSGQR